MSTITVRARTPKGVFPIEGLATSQTTLQQLKQKIQEKSAISSTRQKIKFGFPPKLLEAKDEDTLDKLGFKNGEMLTVEEGPEVVQAQPQAAASTTSESQSGVAKSASVWMPSFNKFTGLPPKPAASVSDDQCSDGKFVRRIIPSDNSCLFASVRYCLEGTDGRKKSNLPLRQLISEVIGNNTSVYNEIFLGQKPQEYRQWILKPENWGGAIELAILADFYEVEICAYDIQSTRVDVFGQGKGYKAQIFILYDGIHYDALAFNVLGDEGPEEIDISLFSVNDKNALSKAMVVVKELNKKRQFTDVGNFSLRCLVCGEGIKGSKEATQHAKLTGHQNFGEN